MSVHEWIQYELRASQDTPFAFFSRCWEQIYGKPCQSNQVILDADRWRKGGVIPSYVWSCYDRMKAAPRRLPSKCVP